MTARDPVRARRARIARLVGVAQRAGYGLFLLAIVLFLLGLVGDLTPGLAAAVIGCLVVGSIILAPAIVAGYAVRAAERDDRERGL